MSLIQCSECNNEVSDKASSCPKCGAPIASNNENIAAGANLKTIQETSKKFKLQALISIFLIIIGAVMLIATSDAKSGQEPSGTGAIILLIGIIWYLINRFRIWWHHK